jgi:hypothetical protein
MVRKAARPEPTATKQLQPLRKNCPHCGQRLGADYDNYRTVITLEGFLGLTLKIRRWRNLRCTHYHRPYRPEAEGRASQSSRKTQRVPRLPPALPPGGGGTLCPASARVRPRCHRPRRHLTLRRAPQYP